MTIQPTEERFEGAGGLKIFFRAWRPLQKPKGVVVISHGFNSHSGYYQWAAEQFVADDLAVYALDHRGRGLSDGERFYVNAFSEYSGDLAQMVSIAQDREPGLPTFLLGHSAGGVIACGYTLHHQDKLAGFICEDFAFQVPAPDFAIAALRGLSHLAPHAGVLKLKNEDFSRDPAAVKVMNDDPLIAHETQPTKTIAEMARADDQLKKDFPKFTLPLLIIHGTKDAVTKPGGSREFYDKAGAVDKTLKLYEGHFHDLLADVGKEDVMSDIRGWISARLRA